MNNNLPTEDFQPESEDSFWRTDTSRQRHRQDRTSRAIDVIYNATPPQREHGIFHARFCVWPPQENEDSDTTINLPTEDPEPESEDFFGKHSSAASGQDTDMLYNATLTQRQHITHTTLLSFVCTHGNAISLPFTRSRPAPSLDLPHSPPSLFRLAARNLI